MEHHIKTFFLRPSTEPSRPQISATDPRNNGQPWQSLNMTLDVESFYSVLPRISIVIADADALEWDLYALAGTLGLFSNRAAQIIERSTRDRFSLCPVELNGAPYFVLRVKSRIHALDTNKSEVVFFPNSAKVMLVRNYAFDESKIPENSVFCIDEVRGEVFCTEEVVNEIGRARLRGFEFKPTGR